MAELPQLGECRERPPARKPALGAQLIGRWKALFHAKFAGLLYDLTGTYFEGHPPFPEVARHPSGYRRDKRFDGGQVGSARSVSPESFPLAGEGLAGHTTDQPRRAGSFSRKSKRQAAQPSAARAGTGAARRRKCARRCAGALPGGAAPRAFAPGEQKLTDLPWQKARGRGCQTPVAKAGELPGLERQREALWLQRGTAQQRTSSAGRLVKVDRPQAGGPGQFGA